eukprot:1283528-Amphidinium_carterae.1
MADAARLCPGAHRMCSLWLSLAVTLLLRPYFGLSLMLALDISHKSAQGMKHDRSGSCRVWGISKLP